jgi:hypothetical protein
VFVGEPTSVAHATVYLCKEPAGRFASSLAFSRRLAFVLSFAVVFRRRLFGIGTPLLSLAFDMARDRAVLPPSSFGIIVGRALASSVPVALAVGPVPLFVTRSRGSGGRKVAIHGCKLVLNCLPVLVLSLSLQPVFGRSDEVLIGVVGVASRSPVIDLKIVL